MSTSPAREEEAPPHRLADILRALPARELEGLIGRLSIPIDEAKRIDAPAQVARALVSLGDVRDTGRLPPPSVQLLHRIAEAGGRLTVDAIPIGLDVLVARGLVFARRRDTAPPSNTSSVSRASSPAWALGVDLVLPTAYLLQLRSWEGEDPRGLRALLAQASFETQSAIATQYLGRPATPPVALALETAWDTLSNPARLRAEIDRLAPLERRLLEAVEREGGELDTEELLDLEREPMRLRGAVGVTSTRRGVGFALERRGLLIGVHPNRHVVPTEVSHVIGAGSRGEREARRAAIRTFVLDSDHAPRRARFATDPYPIAIAMALAIREPGVEVRSGVGTPKSLVARLAQRFGREPEAVALLAALSRAAGLWEPTAASAGAPPGSLRLHQLGAILYETWARGGAWDEARPDPELLRVAADARDPGPTSVVRELVLDALRELGEGRWVPWAAIAGYVRDDARTAGVTRLLRKWAERAGLEAPAPEQIARRIATETLPALGVVDVGPPDELDPDSPGLTLRLTSRGRAWLAGRPAHVEPSPSHFVDAHVLRLGASARVASVLQLATVAEIGRVEETCDLVITEIAVSQALAAGVDVDVVRARIEAVAPIAEELSRAITQASAVVGRGTLVAASAFLWIEDPAIRELLSSRRSTADMFVDPSPQGGLLVGAAVDLDKLVRRCRGVGVEVTLDGSVLRARVSVPPSSPSSSRGGRPSSGHMRVRSPSRP